MKWDNIVGGNVTLSKDWFETRLVYIQSDTKQNYANVVWNAGTQSYDPVTGPVYADSKQRIYGLTANADYQNWIARTEFINIKHAGLGYEDFAQIVAVGYHYGKWQPLATWSRYKGVQIGDGTLPGTTGDQEFLTRTLTLWYDLTTSSDIKAQLDTLGERGVPYYGRSQLLSFTYDKVF